MKWFGRKAASGGARPFLLRGSQGTMAAGGEWPRSYEAQVREAYVGNPVAQRAVRLVAEGVAGASVYDAGEVAPPPSAGGERFPSPDGAQGGSAEALRGVDVIGWDAEPPPPRAGGARSPSPWRGGSGAAPGRGASVGFAGLVTPALLEAVATHVLLHGNAFVQVGCDARGEPAELFALRPERVKVEADAQGWPAAYAYKAGAATARIAARDGMRRPQVVHVKATHPLDDHYGLGCLGAAAGAAAIHNAATRWNKALLDNAARPSGALVYDPGDGGALSVDQYARLKSEMADGFQGAGNAGRPMLLEGGLKWQAMSLSPADMDFVGLKAAAAREIALAFGVPPMLLGLPGDAAYANYREANKALWRLTILPLADKILGALSAALSAWQPGVRLAVDIDQVTALAEDRERLWRQVSAADFLSADEKREMLGFGPQRVSASGHQSATPRSSEDTPVDA